MSRCSIYSAIGSTAVCMSHVHLGNFPSKQSVDHVCAPTSSQRSAENLWQSEPCGWGAHADLDTIPGGTPIALRPGFLQSAPLMLLQPPLPQLSCLWLTQQPAENALDAGSLLQNDTTRRSVGNCMLASVQMCLFVIVAFDTLTVDCLFKPDTFSKQLKIACLPSHRSWCMQNFMCSPIPHPAMHAAPSVAPSHLPLHHTFSTTKQHLDHNAMTQSLTTSVCQAWWCWE
jgi:hypothetical protein